MTDSTSRTPSFRAAMRYWARLGCISFGGPAGQIAIMHRELVEERAWISEARFLHALNYCMVLPGPEAQQLATYIGWLLHRTAGGIVAGVLFVLPSLVILIGLAWIYVAFGHTPLIAAVFYGLKPAVIALVVHAAVRVARRTLTNVLLVGLAAAAFVAIAIVQAPFPLVIAAAGVCGALGGRIWPTRFASAGSPHSATAVVSDAAATDPYLQGAWRRLLGVAAIGLVLWSVPMVVLVAYAGMHGTLTHMAWFFTKAALLTFGGAYAVLPYVYQGAVLHYGWLTPAQMIDGLALGETTPGPLIMVVVFVAFVGAHGVAPWGAQHAFAAALVAALVVTWFTFLPSFLFILGGAPIIEATRGVTGLTAPLTAISAAVVGVIASLAVFFARHVLWPDGLSAAPDWVAVAIALGAWLALTRFARGIVPVLAAGALVGVLVRLSA